MTERRDVWEELSFLAAPDRVGDWRMALLFDAAAEAGVLDDLPATADEVARRRGADARAVRVVLEALAAWDVVMVEGDRFSQGHRAPDADEGAVLRHHARSIRMWTERLPERLGASEQAGPSPRRWGLELWLAGLAVNARLSAPGAVDECLRRVPGARRVLDLGGGHGEYALEFARRGLHATMQDRPEVIELARRQGRLEGAGIDLHAGDFFDTLAPGPFDVVFCAGVSYTYDRARNQELFRRTARLIAPDGALAVHTFLRGRDPRAAVFAVQMLGAAGGDTHGEAEYGQWLSEAGYRSVDVVHLARPPESIVFAAPDAAGRS